MLMPAIYETPWGPIGYITYKRTYARRHRDDQLNAPTEEFTETIERVLGACKSQLHLNFSRDEEQRLRSYFLQLKGSVAGRFLWQLGTKTVDRLGLLSLQNCAFVVVDDPIQPFTWTFDALMLGAGVGYNIQRRFLEKLPAPKQIHLQRKDTHDADFIVPDSREGWVELLHKLLEAHFNTGHSLSYSTLGIRPKGSLIKGFGGVASGPEDLCKGIHAIHQLLNSKQGTPLTSVDCLDIMNIIGTIVVSGNVRRSAQIALGDPDDIAFLQAKRWDLGNIPNWRAMSNNSVCVDDVRDLPEEFWEAYEGKGEPYGLINLPLSRRCGRLGDERYPDPDVEGYNPCAEQALANKETCALAEIFLPNITSQAELFDVSKFLYRIVKHSLALPCHHPDTAAIVNRNRRMGIGVTGYLQASEQQRRWLPEVYEELRKYDCEYSAEHGWPVSIKLTTCKPSGTLSLLAGVTPGIHPGFSRYFIRRIRVAGNSPLIEVCRSHGYPIEAQKNFDGTEDPSTMVVSFPCSYPQDTILTKDVSAIHQLEFVKRLQTDWSDNAVSCTVYYRRKELPAIRRWLEKHYQSSIKSVSFLLHEDHGFLQAPYEEISEDAYRAFVASVRPIVSMDGAQGVDESDIIDNLECESGACPTK